MGQWKGAENKMRMFGAAKSGRQTDGNPLATKEIFQEE
jgi:hypothetical protein